MPSLIWCSSLERRVGGGYTLSCCGSSRVRAPQR